MWIRSVALLALCAVAPSLAAAGSFGPLPAGAISDNVVDDVAAEICRDHLFDPSSLQARLPQGYRLLDAGEYAKADKDVAEWLKRNQQFAAYAVGSLCFVSAGRFVVDGVRVHASAPTPMAFWWARATGPADPRMLGKVEWVQLASWYSRELSPRDRNLVIATDPMAQFVDLQVTPTDPSRWRLRLALPDETVEADVVAGAQRSKRKATEPGFMSVPFSGTLAESFWVITYFGHHHRSASAQWRASGTGVFSKALQIPTEATAFGTLFQDGWSARSGLYRTEP